MKDKPNNISTYSTNILLKKSRWRLQKTIVRILKRCYILKLLPSEYFCCLSQMFMKLFNFAQGHINVGF